MTIALELKQLKKTYPGGVQALRGIDLQVEAGDFYALLGPNGAGKSTLIKLILNMIRRDHGSIQVLGLDNIIDEEAVKERLGVVFDSSYLYEQWKVSKVERIVAPLYPAWNGDRYRRYLDDFGLGGAQNGKKKIKDLSRGMQMKLMLAIALSHDAKLLILDEPTNHLDMRSKDVLKDALKEFDGTVIVVSHDREFLDGLVDKVYEFGNKRVIEHLGGIYDFLEHKKMDSLRELERSTQATASMEGTASEPTQNKLSYEARKEQSKAIKKVEKAIAESERKITELENSISAVEARLATPEGAADVSLYTEYSELKKNLSDTMDLWTEQTLELEELNAANS